MRLPALAAIVFLQSPFMPAQTSAGTPLQPRFHAVAPPQFRADGLRLARRVRTGAPFTVAGPRGVVLGQQEGGFEAWLLPVKLLSHFSLKAQVSDYPVPIDLNAAASEIQVYPDRTVITYSHIALTVRQTMFAPDDAEPGTGAVVLFEVDSIRPVDLSFSFKPEMVPMWPKPTQGNADPEWVAAAGAYILHTDYPNLAGAVTIPGARPGVLAPYQEKPQTHPLELLLHVDPVRDRGRAFPLLMAVGQTPATAASAALLGKLDRLNESLHAGPGGLYARHSASYAALEAGLLSVKTPDAGFDDDIRWAELAIEQLRARTPASREPGAAEQTALVAGYYSSGDSARPGFGWFFGRDALYTLPAVDGMGDYALSRAELEFLISRQRADGKMMHEYSQTAASVDWASLPYQYAAADATPLFLLAMLDYVRASGDVAFLKTHADAVRQAWAFESSHDSDGDGIYDNAQGTGWVEGWPGGQPHQEIYLALLDRQASTAMARLAHLLGDAPLAQAAGARSAALNTTIEAEYFQPADATYAFSRNADGSLDRTPTIYPAVAWWAGGTGLRQPQASAAGWDSHIFSTDWGSRDVAETSPVYDPISYHQGSVWPLFTGWAAVADYRMRRSAGGFAHLMQNADQTTTQDLGAVTELLSGAFFQPFGRSTSHQLWSSAMVLVPALEGLFGVEVDALAGTVSVDPQLPADWPAASIHTLRVGESTCDLSFVRQGSAMRVQLKTTAGRALSLAGRSPGAKLEGGDLLVPLPPVEIALPHGLPLPGARTQGPKILEEHADTHSLTLALEGESGTTTDLIVRVNQAGLNVKAEGLALGPAKDGLQHATVTFGTGTGYQAKMVTLRG